MTRSNFVFLEDFYRLYPYLRGDRVFEEALETINTGLHTCSGPNQQLLAPEEVLDPSELYRFYSQYRYSEDAPLSLAPLWRYGEKRVESELLYPYLKKNYFPDTPMTGDLFSDLSQLCLWMKQKIEEDPEIYLKTAFFTYNDDPDDSTQVIDTENEQSVSLYFSFDETFFDYYAQHMGFEPEQLYLSLGSIFSEHLGQKETVNYHWSGQDLVNVSSILADLAKTFSDYSRQMKETDLRVPFLQRAKPKKKADLPKPEALPQDTKDLKVQEYLDHFKEKVHPDPERAIEYPLSLSSLASVIDQIPETDASSWKDAYVKVGFYPEFMDYLFSPESGAREDFLRTLIQSQGYKLIGSYVAKAEKTYSYSGILTPRQEIQTYRVLHSVGKESLPRTASLDDNLNLVEI